MLLERKEEIISEIKQKKRVRVNELAQRLQVTEVTIRRDLQELESLGVLIRTHGGAVLNEHIRKEPSVAEKSSVYNEEKSAIGKMAASLIKPGDTIALDAGTTTVEIAKLIAVPDLTVVTNSISIAAEIGRREDIEIILTGGTLRWNTQALVGALCDETLSNLRVDKVFFGTNGITIKQGATTPNLLEAQSKRLLVEIATQVIVVCDSSKFGKISFAKIVDIDQIDIAVTDFRLPQKVREQYVAAGVDVIIADS